MFQKIFQIVIVVICMFTFYGCEQDSILDAPSTENQIKQERGRTTSACEFEFPCNTDTPDAGNGVCSVLLEGPALEQLIRDLVADQGIDCEIESVEIDFQMSDAQFSSQDYRFYGQDGSSSSFFQTYVNGNHNDNNHNAMTIKCGQEFHFDLRFNTVDECQVELACESFFMQCSTECCTDEIDPCDSCEGVNLNIGQKGGYTDENGVQCCQIHYFLEDPNGCIGAFELHYFVEGGQWMIATPGNPDYPNYILVENCNQEASVITSRLLGPCGFDKTVELVGNCN